MRYFVTIDGQEHVVEVDELPSGEHTARILPSGTESAGGTPIQAEVAKTDAGITVKLAGRVYDLVLDGDLPNLTVWASGKRAAVQVESARMRSAGALHGRAGESADGAVTSPMPGKVVKVLVKEGDEVAAGAPLVVVEAMKMENELTAPCAGVVQKVHVQPGDAVEGGALLVLVA